MNQRKHHNTRTRIDELLATGWQISGREPLRLIRANGVAEVRPNGMITYGRK